MNNKIRLGILTVDYNGHSDTKDLLESLKKTDKSDFELKVVVVDNGSLQAIPPEWEELYDLEILQTGENKGFAGGYNQGMRYLYAWGADYILLINNDTILADKHFFKKLIDTARSDEKMAMVSPKILFAPNFEYQKDRYTAADRGKVVWYGGGYFDWDNVRVVHEGIDEVDIGKYDRVGPMDFISGCCVLVTRKCLEEVGYLDERLFAYFEDADWIMRLKNKGLKTYYSGNTYLFHKVSRTSGIGSPVTDYLLTRNRLYFGFKYARLRTKIALVREALRQIRNGRPMQKLAIRDLVKGKYYLPKQLSKEGPNLILYPKRLSVVIVNYQTKELIKKLLASIYKNGSGFDKNSDEVIVVDNNSEDKCGEMIKDDFKAVKFVQSPRNLGFSGGYNLGIGFTRGKYLLLLNSDVEVENSGIEKLINMEETLKTSGVLGPALILPDGNIQKSCFKLPTISGAINEYFWGKTGNYGQFIPRGESTSSVEGLVMACFFLPREIFNRIGWLSEKTFMYFEDIDYCRRLKKLGEMIYYCPEVKFLHHHGASSKMAGNELSKQRLEEAARWYHGKIRYQILYWVLRTGQKWRKIFSFGRLARYE